jgi:hypothetical protein
VKLYIVDPPFPEDREPGMMWRWGEAWWIMLPSHPLIGTPGHPGELSWRTTDIASDGKPWEVTGEAPNLTVFPSINVINPADGSSYWHGWIRNGELVEA